MRVLYPDVVVDPYRPGESGTSNTIWAMAEQLIGLGHGAVVAGAYLAQSYPSPSVPVRIYHIPALLRRNIFGVVLSHMLLARYIARRCGDCDLIHTRDYLLAVILDRLCRQPIVVTVAGSPAERASKGLAYFDMVTEPVYRWAAAALARSHCRVVVTSTAMDYWWRVTGVPPEQIAQLPLGVDTERFSPRQDARTRLGWAPDRFHVLYVGRLLGHLKGLEELIDCLPAAAQVPIQLHMVGDGPARSALIQRITGLGLETRVQLHGWALQRDLPDYYSAADLCVLPSRSEGFGRTMLESMSCGCAFLGTPVGGMADHLIDGATGFVLDTISPQALASALVTLGSDRQRVARVGNAGRRYVLEQLSWAAIVRRLSVEVYQPLVSQAAGRSAPGWQELH